MSTYSDAQDYLSKNGANAFVQKYGIDPAAYFQQNYQTSLNAKDPNNGYTGQTLSSTTDPHWDTTLDPSQRWPDSPTNQANPNGEADKPFNQSGDDKYGWIDGIGQTIGPGSSLTQAQADAYYNAGVAKFGKAAVDDFLSRNKSATGVPDYARIDSGLSDDGGSGGGSSSGSGSDAGSGSGAGSGSNSTATDAWMNSSSNSLFPDWYKSLMEQTVAQQQAQQAADQAKADSLYNQLAGIASQSQNVNANDPIIRNQTDAFNAKETQQQRKYLADVAESGGPLANIAGERRMTSQSVGQDTAGYQASLIAQELQSRRDQIAQALAQQGSLLSASQQRDLQGQLATMDQAIAEANVGTPNRSLSLQDLISQRQTALGQGQLGLGYANLAQNNDQFLRSLGFSDWDRQMYYDLVQQGLL